MRTVRWIGTLVLAVSVLGGAPETRSVTRTGFFADEACARGRANSGVYTGNNPDCAKKCLDNGSAAVFVDEHAKALFTVKDYGGVKDDLGYHLEITGVVDEAAKTVSVKSVKRLEYIGASCARPQKK
jgi:hypothetical protein